ncbi:MAG: hypothetical protein U1B79_01605 [Candidatus Pacearchaeota archaeon]|nr:hypothetical protein [Nanoarchaeota archaeon]MDZ4226785.1 hypothetical protein [Candidatus Pacearchaeota archaeon]
MTTIETAVKEIKSVDFRTLELKLGDSVSIDGREEIIIETTVTEKYDMGKRLERFRTIRREENGVIAESGYSVNGNTGKEHLDYSGIVREKDGVFNDKNNRQYTAHASKRYSKLNKILEEQEQKK